MNLPVLAIYMALCSVSATGHVEETTPSLLMVCNLVPVIGSIASHTSDFLPTYKSNKESMFHTDTNKVALVQNFNIFN